jgi:hypothetical protein
MENLTHTLTTQFGRLAVEKYVDNFYKEITIKKVTDYFVTHSFSNSNQEYLFDASFLNCISPTGEVWRLRTIERGFDDFRFHFYLVDCDPICLQPKYILVMTKTYSNEDARLLHQKLLEIDEYFNKFNCNVSQFIFFNYSDLNK